MKLHLIKLNQVKIPHIRIDIQGLVIPLLKLQNQKYLIIIIIQIENKI
jgi:hypothetical protein